MHELKEKVAKIDSMEKQLICVTEGEFAKGMENVCTQEAGAVIDMIKDLADAKKNCWKAMYYKSIVEAMEKEKEMEDLAVKMGEATDRMGYDRYRWSSGRFAPKGHGHETSMAEATGRSGFIPWPPVYGPDGMPMTDSMGILMTTEGPHIRRMGYPGEDHIRDGRMNDASARADSHWDRYQMARRHYTENQTPETRQEMTREAKEYLQESVDTIRDIWVQADPELQQKMKKDLLALMREMGM